MFTDQRGGVSGSAAQGGLAVSRIGGIAQGDGNVAEPPFMPDAADGVAGQAVVEFLFCPGKKFSQAG